VFLNGQVEELDVSALPTEVAAVTGPAPAASQAQVAGMLATIILGLCQRAGGSTPAAEHSCHELQTTPSDVVLYDAGEQFHDGVSWKCLYVFLCLALMLGFFFGWTFRACYSWRSADPKSSGTQTAAAAEAAEYDARSVRHREWDDQTYAPRTSATSFPRSTRYPFEAKATCSTPNLPSSSRDHFANERISREQFLAEKLAEKFAEKPEQENQRVQGPVTYRRDLAHPRYQPLPGWQFGSTEEHVRHVQ
jgi:hypothetical protein